jgi:hypothetical protein
MEARRISPGYAICEPCNTGHSEQCLYLKRTSQPQAGERATIARYRWDQDEDNICYGVMVGPVPDGEWVRWRDVAASQVAPEVAQPVAWVPPASDVARWALEAIEAGPRADLLMNLDGIKDHLRRLRDTPSAAPQAVPQCIGADPLCPCQDGLACHYRDAGETRAMPLTDDARDAARYRWLRDGETIARYPYPVLRMGGDRMADRTIWDEELDDAIDAAMAEEPKT